MKVFDLHCDTVNKCAEKNTDIFDVSLAFKIVSGLKQKRFFALWQDETLDGKAAELKGEELYNKYFQIEKQLKGTNVIPFFSVENSSCIGDDTQRISLWKERGLKMASLTWNGENNFAHGCDCERGGLKKPGKAFLKRFEEENIVLDVSHLNVDSFKDVCSLSSKPIVASHSNCFAVCPHKRNLYDWQIKEIISCGGLIGICFYPLFLGKGDVFENVYRNICYVLTLGGENTVALGSDFDGAEMNDKLCSCNDLINLYNYLIERGLTEVLLSKIFFKNSEKFFNNVLQC